MTRVGTQLTRSPRNPVRLNPLDQPADLKNANRYAYAAANPTNYTDPTGEAIPAAGLVVAAGVRYSATRFAASATGRRVGTALSRRAYSIGTRTTYGKIGRVRQVAEEYSRDIAENVSQVFAGL